MKKEEARWRERKMDGGEQKREERSSKRDCISFNINKDKDRAEEKLK